MNNVVVDIEMTAEDAVNYDTEGLNVKPCPHTAYLNDQHLDVLCGEAKLPEFTRWVAFNVRDYEGAPEDMPLDEVQKEFMTDPLYDEATGEFIYAEVFEDEDAKPAAEFMAQEEPSKQVYYIDTDKYYGYKDDGVYVSYSIVFQE